MKEGEKATFLILDDDDIFRNRLARAFRVRGFEVFVAANCQKARELVSEEFFDYAVLDLCLPDGSGLDLIAPLIESRPQVRAAILTGYGTISTAVEAVKRGAVQFLTKPTNADAILAALQGEMESERSVSDIPTLAQVEWEHMQRVLSDCGGNITRAAKMLGLHRRSLQRKLLKNPGNLS